jgi:hypothetical protein
MPRFPSNRTGTILFILLLSLVGLYSPIGISVAQSVHTSVVTQATTVYSTGTLTSTLTSPAIVYTTTTATLNSTVSGTQVVTQTSGTMITVTYTTLLSRTVTQTVTSVVSQASTQTTQLLGNIGGELLALVLVVAASTAVIVPRVRSPRPKGLTCKQCGYRNPPFVTSFCVKCGHSLKQK